MKLAFVDVRYKHQVTLPASFLAKLPKKVILFLNIQFHAQYASIKEQLEQHGITVLTVRPKHAWHEGQILGCSMEEWSVGHEGFVYVGDGLFHPTAVLFRNPEPVYMYDPKTGKERVLTQADIADLERKHKGAMATFLAAQRVGVLITTKYGQSRLKPALKLQEQYPDKTFYYLLADVIDFGKLEDFPFLEVFVNTACPRIIDDTEKVPRPMVNIEDLGTVW